AVPCRCPGFELEKPWAAEAEHVTLTTWPRGRPLKEYIFNSTSRKEIFRYKSNKIYTGPICGKLQNSDEKIKDLNKWRYIPCSWIGTLNIVKMSILPNLISRFNAIPIKIAANYFVGLRKLILKCIWKGKGPKTANRVLKNKNKFRGFTFSDFKTHNRATVVKAM
uniref:Uncharacterized protein n=1 Tax=Equus caballus TaxID=9796 RepID=A0A9L0T5D1_HORSE